MVTAAQIHSFTKYVHFECHQSIYRYIFISYTYILIFIYHNKTYKNKSKNVLQILFIPSHLQAYFTKFCHTFAPLCADSTRVEMVQKREFAEHSLRRKGLARGSFYNAAEDEPPFGQVGHPAPTANHGGVHNGSKTCQTCYTNKPG